MKLYFIPLLSSGVRGGLPTQFEKEPLEVFIGNPPFDRLRVTT